MKNHGRDLNKLFSGNYKGSDDERHANDSDDSEDKNFEAKLSKSQRKSNKKNKKQDRILFSKP